MNNTNKEYVKQAIGNPIFLTARWPIVQPVLEQWSQNLWNLQIPAPQLTPVLKLTLVSMAWSVSIAQLGWLPGCTPTQLLLWVPQVKKDEELLESPAEG